jgi:nicotinamidase-related amidase
MAFHGYALLVIDAQQQFLGGVVESILQEVNSTIDLCHALKTPVIFTLHGHLFPGTYEAEDESTSAALRWWGVEKSIKQAMHLGTQASLPKDFTASSKQNGAPSDRCCTSLLQAQLLLHPCICRVGTWEWQLVPGLHCDPERDIRITSKRTYDAFRGTELLSVLRQMGVTQLAIAGVLTNVCCETTARCVCTNSRLDKW